MKSFTLVSVLLAVAAAAPAEAPKSAGLRWEPWSDQLFSHARAEKRFVLLDLEAVWCHWCHVMDATTYADPQVAALLRAGYITVRVDQDSRPDLASRYEDYGWPATIVFDGAGREIVRRRGYIAPKEMIGMLRAINADPSPGPSVVAEPELQFPANGILSAGVRDQLRAKYVAGYDAKQGSWGFDYKYLEPDSVEYSLVLAQAGNAEAAARARQTLNAQLNLLDPVWGGFYQYSTGGNWKEPHFEKIMWVQAANLRLYAIAYQQFGDAAYLEAAKKTEGFLRMFLLSPQGAFYTSQDADVIPGQHSAEYFRLDDRARRHIGVPRVDRHIYARENGQAIEALTVLYAMTGEARYLAEAERAAGWIVQNRALPGGGFRHDERDAAGPFLADSLAMGRAFLSLYQVTADRKWLHLAEQSCRFILQNFANAKAPGFVTSKTRTDAAYSPRPERDENATLARFANLLFQYTGRSEFRAASQSAMRYLAAPAIALRVPTATVLLADRELSQEPLHITVVGRKDDPAARALFLAANRWPSGYKRVEWWDRREGTLPRSDVSYPETAKPAAYLCTATSCSSPVHRAEDLHTRIAKRRANG